MLERLIRRAFSLRQGVWEVEFMDEARIEYIARAMSRSAGLDPDALVDPEMGAAYFASISPANTSMPAWQRFRLAAENFVAARDEFADRMPPSRSERERLGGR